MENKEVAPLQKFFLPEEFGKLRAWPSLNP